jgi:phosphatidylserine/phosphatidylglycerophosphate/cardiolipin synthase-like enzyme
VSEHAYCVRTAKRATDLRHPSVALRSPSFARGLALPLAALLTIGMTFWLLASQRDAQPTPVATPSAGASWLTIYRTDPFDPASESLRGGPDARLAEAIDAAAYSVEVAIYHLNLWSVRDALLRAAGRGVRVRVVVESDGMFDREVQDLVQAGIPVLGDRRESLMHHKFTLIDGLEVWTGSMNYSVGSAYRDHNVLLRLRSSALAENYAREFDEMFVDDRFGPLSIADTPHPALTINGTPVEAWFSPDDGVAARLIQLIEGAQSRVDFLAFTFTSDPLAEALLRAAERGVTVRGVIERDQVEAAGTDYDRMRQAGIDVRLDSTPGTMHHKLLLIDGRVLVTGSYNFTRSAEESNDENVVILFSPAAAGALEPEFAGIYEAAVP